MAHKLDCKLVVLTQSPKCASFSKLDCKQDPNEPVWVTGSLTEMISTNQIFASRGIPIEFG